MKKKIKKGDKVTYRGISMPLLGKVVAVKGKIAHVIWESFTEPGKTGKVPIKDLIVIP